MASHKITLLFLGDDKVGKSTFLAKLSQGRQSLSKATPVSLLRDADQPFVFELRNRRHEYRIEAYDTASPGDWRQLQPDMVIICYDISQRLSLINLQRVWLKLLRTTFPSADNTPLLVLGLKRDLRSEHDPNGIISPHEAHRVAAEMRADKYMECSAVTGELVDLAFEDICTSAVGATKEDGGQSEGGCGIM